MNLEMVAVSDTGNQRKINEDYYGLYKDEKLALLCDGMGGHNAGLKASELAVSTIYHFFRNLREDEYIKIVNDLNSRYPEIANRMICAIRLANRHIFQTQIQDEKLLGMGTTLAALAFQDNIACLGHVGDSRIYRFRNGKLERLTQDHSLLNELIQDQEIKIEDAHKFKRKNVITRALGLNQTVKIDMCIDEVEDDDVFLLCSDGLTGGVPDDEIERILNDNIYDLEYVANSLLGQSLIIDGSDNITIILIRVENVNSKSQIQDYISDTINDDDENVNRKIESLLRSHGFAGYRGRRFSQTVSKYLGKKYRRYILYSIFLITFIACIRFIFTRDENNIPEELNSREIETIEDSYTDNRYNSNGKSIPIPRIDAGDEQDENKLVKKQNHLSSDETKSLNQLKHNQGIVYLVGFQKLEGYDQFYVELDKRILGKLSKYVETGLKLKPGRHTLKILDDNKVEIFKQENILISAGDIKAIEAQ